MNIKITKLVIKFYNTTLCCDIDFIGKFIVSWLYDSLIQTKLFLLILILVISHRGLFINKDRQVARKGPIYLYSVYFHFLGETQFKVFIISCTRVHPTFAQCCKRCEHHQVIDCCSTNEILGFIEESEEMIFSIKNAIYFVAIRMSKY